MLKYMETIAIMSFFQIQKISTRFEKSDIIAMVSAPSRIIFAEN